LHARGILFILVCNPVSLGILKSPGEWGADLAVGDGQPWGIPLNFGGPYLGFFSATRALIRQMPGRLCGLTQDREGRRAFCLTLQAREQHIRRERASSNICTNQALCALAACVTMTLLGKQGVRDLAQLNLDRTHYLRERLSAMKNCQVDTDSFVFNEFCVRSKQPFGRIQEKMLLRGILPGIELGVFYPELSNEFLVCATETKTREQLDFFAEELSRC